MKIIKLEQIGSTNDFLKDYNKKEALPNFTIVTTNNQTQGRGQQDKKWLSEPDKNLTFSILVKNIQSFNCDIFILNMIVSNSIFKIINILIKKKVSIKWPNDILIGNKKICGILIELTHKSNASIDAIIGIGINVNQTFFNDLANVTSLKTETKKEYILDDLLHQIATEIKNRITHFSKEKTQHELNTYNTNLYKKDQPCTFKLPSDKFVMRILSYVSIDGKIHLTNEDKTTETYTTGNIQIILPT